MLLEAPNPRCQVQTHQSFPGGRAGSNSASKCFKKDQWTRSLFWRHNVRTSPDGERYLSQIYSWIGQSLSRVKLGVESFVLRFFWSMPMRSTRGPRRAAAFVVLNSTFAIGLIHITGNAFRINCSFVNNRLKPSVPNDTLIPQLWQEEGIIWQSRTWGHWIRLPSRHQLNLGTATSLWNHLIRGKLVIRTRSSLSVNVDELHSPGVCLDFWSKVTWNPICTAPFAFTSSAKGNNKHFSIILKIHWDTLDTLYESVWFVQQFPIYIYIYICE